MKQKKIKAEIKGKDKAGKQALKSSHLNEAKGKLRQERDNERAGKRA